MKPILYLIFGLLLNPSVILAQQANRETFKPRYSKEAEESGFLFKTGDPRLETNSVQKATPGFYTPRNSKVAEESGFPVNFYEQQSRNAKEIKGFIPSLGKAFEATDEEAVWKLEEAYWAYVKSNNLVGYQSLWNEEFVG